MDAKQLRIVFMGTPEFAVPSLRALVAGGYNVVGVVTTPDKPAGRGQKLHESEVKVAAQELGLPVLQPEKLKSPEFIAQMEALNPDLGIVIAFRMLPEVIWAMPRFGTFNLHASLLPQYRGAAPINWAIINGDTETGVTTFLLNHEIDKGAIIGQIRVPIGADDTIGSLYEKLMTIGTGLVTETVDKIAQGHINPIEQMHIDESTLRTAPKIFKEDCRIDWSWNGHRIVNFVRGLSPYPAAWAPMRRVTETLQQLTTVPSQTATETPQQLTTTHPSQTATETLAQSPAGNSCPDTLSSNNSGKIVSAGGNVMTSSSETSAKIFSARFESAAHGKPCGTVESDNRAFIRVACADGWIELGELQIAGKKRMSVHDLLLGLRDINDYMF